MFVVPGSLKGRSHPTECRVSPPLAPKKVLPTTHLFCLASFFNEWIHRNRRNTNINLSIKLNLRIQVVFKSARKNKVSCFFEYKDSCDGDKPASVRGDMRFKSSIKSWTRTAKSKGNLVTHGKPNQGSRQRNGRKRFYEISIFPSPKVCVYTKVYNPCHLFTIFTFPVLITSRRHVPGRLPPPPCLLPHAWPRPPPAHVVSERSAPPYSHSPTLC